MLRLRLCDDDGIVSKQSIQTTEVPRTLDACYLERHNRLSGQRQEAPFACTGSAHIGGMHIRCTSRAHRPSAVIGGNPLA